MVSRIFPAFALVAALCSLTGCATDRTWGATDTALQWGVTGAMLCDAWTTSKIQDYPNVYEGGPVASRVLGSQPGTTETYLYFATLAISNYAISYVLPDNVRPFWQGGHIAYHTSLCFGNMATMDLP